MKFKKNLYMFIQYFVSSLFFLLVSIFCFIISNHIALLLMLLFSIMCVILSFIPLFTNLIINDAGIIVYKSNNKKVYEWKEIKYYQNDSLYKLNAIKVTLIDDTCIYLDGRKKIKNEIIKHCGNIPDMSDVGKDGRFDRYNNYTEKFIDLYGAEFEKCDIKDGICVFCNINISKINDRCYCTKKNNSKYYICSRCFNDFKKYYLFKKSDE